MFAWLARANKTAPHARFPVGTLAFVGTVGFLLLYFDFAAKGASHVHDAYPALMLAGLFVPRRALIFFLVAFVTGLLLAQPLLGVGAVPFWGAGLHRPLWMLAAWVVALASLGRARDRRRQRELEARSRDVEASVARIEGLLSSLSSVLIEVDAGGVIQRWNTAAERVLGRTSGEVLGKHLREVGVAWDIEALLGHIECSREGGRERKAELKYHTAGGKPRTLGFRITTTERTSGNAAGHLIQGKDITERIADAERQRRLITAVEQVDEAIVVTDPDGVVLYVNPAFERITGYSVEETERIGPRALCPEAGTESSFAAVRDVLLAGNVWSGRFTNVRKDGTGYEEEATISPVRNDDGVISHFVAVKRDISEFLSMETQLRKAQKLESIGQLAAGIAHEINTPTQYIGDNARFLQGAFETLQGLLECCVALEKSGAESETSAEVVQSIIDACESANLSFMMEEIPEAIEESLSGLSRVTAIVSAMKAFSHPGSGERELFNINENIERTITLCTNEWKYVSTVETHLDPDLPLVPGFAGEMNQVILNMIVNAAHAIESHIGRASLEKGLITVTTRSLPGAVEIIIGDSGCGMPPHVVERIFDPFFTTKEVGKGTGQGLAISHSVVVDKHGGTIVVDSEPGGGTKFIIRLPLTEESMKETDGLVGKELHEEVES